MKCSELMTRDPACCQPGDSVTQVASIMKREDVGAVPVVESHDNKKLIGIVTDRDLVVKVLAGGTPADRATARDAMTASVASCGEDEDVDRAISLMSEHQVRRLPVTDREGRLAGIIAQADVATRLKRDETTGELVEAISEPGFGRK